MNPHESSQGTESLISTNYFLSGMLTLRNNQQMHSNLAQLNKSVSVSYKYCKIFL